MRGGFGLALVALCACGGTRKDTLSADVCRETPAEWSELIPAAELRARAAAASHVVRGRIRWTGSVIDVEHTSQRELGYVVVDILEFHQGDAWSVDPRMRRSFPLLGNQPELRALNCRTGEAFFFFVDLSGESWPGGTPDPVFRAFGERAVELVAIVPESAAESVRAALAAP